MPALKQGRGGTMDRGYLAALREFDIIEKKMDCSLYEELKKTMSG